MEATITVSFHLTKQLDDFESVRVQGGISFPAEIKNEEDYKRQYKHWLKVVQDEVIDQTYKYYKAIQKIKQEGIKKKKQRDDLA